MGTITDMDVRDQVIAALGGREAEYDVDAIVAALIAEQGRRTDYDDEAFWPVVAAHELPAPPDPFESFVTELSAVMAAVPAGEPAVWSDGAVTVRVQGASRVALVWPQVLAHVTIVAPDGAVEEIDGLDVGSWEELWDRVQIARTEWQNATDRLLEHLSVAHAGLTRVEQAVEAARGRRDVLVREAIAAGVTPYRIAKRLGVAESTIGRIRR